jgi:hypothetical protein
MMLLLQDARLVRLWCGGARAVYPAHWFLDASEHDRVAILRNSSARECRAGKHDNTAFLRQMCSYRSQPLGCHTNTSWDTLHTPKRKSIGLALPVL